MTFKVGDKVRCVEGGVAGLTLGKIYTITRIFDSNYPYVIDDHGENNWFCEGRFELVQEDKLPHELLGLPRLWYIKTDKANPLWGSFWKRYEEFYNYKWYSKWQYFGFDNHIEPGVNASDNEDFLKKRGAKLITLAERDKCVNKKQSQTKKPIRSCEYNGSVYTRDTIDGVSIEEMRKTMSEINSKLLIHSDLFKNKL